MDQEMINFADCYIYCSTLQHMEQKEQTEIWKFPFAVPSFLSALSTITIVPQYKLLTQPCLCILSFLQYFSHPSMNNFYFSLPHQ